MDDVIPRNVFRKKYQWWPSTNKEIVLLWYVTTVLLHHLVLWWNKCYGHPPVSGIAVMKIFCWSFIIGSVFLLLSTNIFPRSVNFNVIINKYNFLLNQFFLLDIVHSVPFWKFPLVLLLLVWGFNYFSYPSVYKLLRSCPSNGYITYILQQYYQNITAKQHQNNMGFICPLALCWNSVHI